MCLLILLRDVVPNWPLVVAANREERFDRPTERPTLLNRTPSVFGGKDLRAGGTWLAVNQWGMLCAVTNRPRQEAPADRVRSRGLLCLDASRQKSPIAVADLMGRAVQEQAYDGFNLVCATTAVAKVFYYDGALREKQLGHAVTVLSTGEANDRSLDKVRCVYERLEGFAAEALTAWIERLEAVCRSHCAGPDGRGACCEHLGEAGTVSSSILAFHDRDPRKNMFRHAPGPPCQTTYETLEWPYNFFETQMPPPSAFEPME